MTGLTFVVLLAVAAVVVPVAGVVSSVETALAQLSVARVESLVKEERPGAARLQRVIDNRPDHINLLVLIRTVLEAGAAVLVTIGAGAFLPSAAIPRDGPSPWRWSWRPC